MLNIYSLIVRPLFPCFLHHYCLQILYTTNFLTEMFLVTVLANIVHKQLLKVIMGNGAGHAMMTHTTQKRMSNRSTPSLPAAPAGLAGHSYTVDSHWSGSHRGGDQHTQQCSHDNTGCKWYHWHRSPGGMKPHTAVHSV